MTNQQLLQTNIITALGLQSLPDEEKSTLVQGMADLVQERVILRVIESLSEEDRKTLDALLGSKGAENDGVAEFVRTKVPNFTEIFDEELAGVKGETIDFIKKLEK